METEEGFGREDVPSGESNGTKEAGENWDDDKRGYGGKGVLKAVEAVNTIIKPSLSEEEMPLKLKHWRLGGDKV